MHKCRKPASRAREWQWREIGADGSGPVRKIGCRCSRRHSSGARSAPSRGRTSGIRLLQRDEARGCLRIKRAKQERRPLIAGVGDIRRVGAIGRERGVENEIGIACQQCEADFRLLDAGDTSRAWLLQSDYFRLGRRSSSAAPETVDLWRGTQRRNPERNPQSRIPSPIHSVAAQDIRGLAPYPRMVGFSRKRGTVCVGSSSGS